MPGASPASPAAPAWPWRAASHLSVTSTVKPRNDTRQFCETLEPYQGKVLPEGVIRTEEEQWPGLLSFQAGFLQPSSPKPGKKVSPHVEGNAAERRSPFLPLETLSLSALSRLR